MNRIESTRRCDAFSGSLVRRWASLAGTIAATLALAGCATHERVVTREVRVPVSAPCLTKPPGQTSYAADAVSLDGTIFDLVQALLIDREQRKVSELNLRAALTGCVP